MTLDKKLIGVLEKLAQFGATTEKKIMSLNDRDMLSLEMDYGAKAPERLMVIELKEAIVKNRGVSYILGGLEEEERKNADKGNKSNDIAGTETKNREHAGGNYNQH